MKFLKFGLALLCSALVWEVIVRIAFLNSPGSHNDPVLGRIVNPGLYIHGEEGYAITTFNNLGMRGSGIRKKEKTRYLALGDSFTEALQVRDGATFCDILQSLRQNSEVVNAGRGGASPANYIHLAEYYKSELTPDHTIIQLDYGDFYDDLFQENNGFYLEKHGSNYITVKNEGVTSNNIFARNMPQVAKIVSDLSLPRKASRNLQAIMTDHSAAKTETPTLDKDAASWVLQQLKYSYENVVLLYIPSIDYENINDVDKLESYLQRQSDQLGLDFINMRKPFVEYYKKTHQPPHGFNNTTPGTGHINEIGHKLIANALNNYYEQVNK